MFENRERFGDLPIRRDLALISLFSLIIASLITVASIASLTYRHTVYQTDEFRRAFVANDVVNPFIGLPLLPGSMWLARRGSLIGLLCWPGALLCIACAWSVAWYLLRTRYAFGPEHWIEASSTVSAS